jgi:hypothetical protein
MGGGLNFHTQMLSNEKTASISTELVARVGVEQARVVIEAAKQTIRDLFATHGEVIGGQVILTLAIIINLDPENKPTSGRN